MRLNKSWKNLLELTNKIKIKTNERVIETKTYDN